MGERARTLAGELPDAADAARVWQVVSAQSIMGTMKGYTDWGDVRA